MEQKPEQAAPLHVEEGWMQPREHVLKDDERWKRGSTNVIVLMQPILEGELAKIGKKRKVSKWQTRHVKLYETFLEYYEVRKTVRLIPVRTASLLLQRFPILSTRAVPCEAFVVMARWCCHAPVCCARMCLRFIE